MSNLVMTRNGRLVNRNRNASKPFHSFNSLMNELFNDDFVSTGRTNFNRGISLPKVNIQEVENEFKVEMAVPGFKKEDFKVSFENEELIISAEVEERKEENEREYSRKEFGYASFQRTFMVPDIIEGDKIEAKYEDGILSIALPKKEEAKPKPARQISIS